ncbi:MAG: lysylphosphatidylglycerol synthase transmembrane domain-containing protein [Acetivibrionales bacterium]|jgi:uncharacterized protein (TIRG00374 family)
MIKKFFKAFVILSSAIILMLLIFFTDGFEELVNMLVNAKYRWIAASFACMVVYWLVDSAIIQIIVAALHKRQRPVDSLKVAMIGNFFNSITPFALGGQPAQVYVMVKDGIKPGHAASVFVIKSALYQVVIMLYCLVVVFAKGPFFAQRIPEFYLLYFTGLIINVITILVYALFVFKRKAAYKLLMFVNKLLKKIRFLKNSDRLIKKVEKELISFTDGVSLLRNKKGVVYGAVILQAVQFTLLFAVPYFIYLAVQGGGASMWNIVAAQSVVTMVTLLVPSPGSTGGAEGLSYLFFKMFFKPEIIIPVILIWRIITYYSNIVFGGLISVFAPEKPLKNRLE